MTKWLLEYGTAGVLGYLAYALAGWTGWGIFMVAVLYGLILGATG